MDRAKDESNRSRTGEVLSDEVYLYELGVQAGINISCQYNDDQPHERVDLVIIWRRGRLCNNEIANLAKKANSTVLELAINVCMSKGQNQSEISPLNTTEDSAAVNGHSDGQIDGLLQNPENAVFNPTSTSARILTTVFELDEGNSSAASEPKASWYHAAFHTVAAVVGAGVLALPYSFSYLTWGGGITCLAACLLISLYCSHLLADAHVKPDGSRINRYRDLGRHVLGYRAGTWAVLPIQFAVCVGLDTAYALTAGQSLQAVQNPACNSHTVEVSSSTANQGCATALSWWIAGFIIFQILLSQLRDFHSLWWVSLIGALMSVFYSTIAFAASVAAVDKNRGLVSHSMRDGTSAQRIFGVMNALGTIMFAFGGQAVQLEIQATLARPPSPYKEMMKGIYLAYAIIVAAYFGVSVAGFAAFGNTINPDILLSIKDPAWLIKIANLMVVVHVAASFQIFAQPVFEAVEGVLNRLLRITEKEIPQIIVRVITRLLYCAVCGALAIVLPFFNDVIGIVGSIGFVPLSFIYPCLFYILQRKYKSSIALWANIAIIFVMTTTGLMAFIASLRNIIVKAEHYHRGR